MELSDSLSTLEKFKLINNNKLLKFGIYILKRGDLLNTNVFKIGKTERSLFTRYNEYDFPGTYILNYFPVIQVSYVERNIIANLKKNNKVIRRLDLGKEYFEGDYNIILESVLKKCSEYIVEHKFDIANLIKLCNINHRPTINNNDYKYNLNSIDINNNINDKIIDIQNNNLELNIHNLDNQLKELFNLSISFDFNIFNYIDNLFKKYNLFYNNELLYLKQKEYFEKYHFIISEPPRIIKINEDNLYHYTYTQILNIYSCLSNNFIKKWKVDSSIRRYTKIDFIPSDDQSNDTIYNLYNNIPRTLNVIENQDIDIFLNHCYYLSGKNIYAKEYLLDYLAHLIQKPSVLPNIAIIFKHNYYTDISLFFYKLFINIFDINNILNTKDISNLLTRSAGKIVSIVDNIIANDLLNDNINKIISSNKINIKLNNKDAYDVNNYCRFLFFTNNDTPIKIEMSDRRFMVFECSDEVKKIENYFKNLSNSLDDMSKIKGFYNFLLKRDIENINLEKDRVITDSYLDIQSVNIPIIIRFIKYYVCQYIMPDNLIELELEEHEYSNPIKDIQNKKEKISVSKFYDIFKKWNTDYNYNSKYNITQFGREITKYINKNIGITKIKNSSIYYNFDFNLLTKYFIDNPLI